MLSSAEKKVCEEEETQYTSWAYLILTTQLTPAKHCLPVLSLRVQLMLLPQMQPMGSIGWMVKSFWRTAPCMDWALHAHKHTVTCDNCRTSAQTICTRESTLDFVLQGSTVN